MNLQETTTMLDDSLSQARSIAWDLYTEGEKIPGVCENRSQYRLAKRIARKMQNDSGKNSLILCAVVEHVRVYGGSEEGGWWRNISQVVEVKQVFRWQRATSVLRDFKKGYICSRFGIYSCGNQGQPDYTFHCVSSDEELEGLDNSREPVGPWC